jgi:Domain of unknown function (DUF4189)
MGLGEIRIVPSFAEYRTMVRRSVVWALALMIVALLLPGTAIAQTPCPSGPGPGQRIVGQAQSGNGVAGVLLCVDEGPPAPPVPMTLWDRNWGALAYDSNTARWYASDHYESERKVRAGLLKYCVEQGAKCAVQLTYANQCAAVARAFDNGKEMPGHDSANTGGTETAAKENAIKSCSADWGGRQCSVIMSSCSNNTSRTVYR